MSKESKISYAGGDDEGIKTYAGVFYDRGALEYFYQSRFFIRGQVFGVYIEAFAERFHERINRIVDG